MKTVTLQVPDLIYDFYAKVGRRAGKPTEQVMSDGLFQLAGRLSAEMQKPLPFPRP